MASPIHRTASKVHLSNLDKLFYPKAKFTKGDVIDYYTEVASFILPHLRNRPVTMVRFPDGVRGKHFYEKNAPGFTPDWVRTSAVPRRHASGKINYILVNNVPTLAWCANLAAIEFHPFLHRARALDRPTSVAFDLDPGEGSTLLDCADVAFHIKELLDVLGLHAFAKVTGSKGLQVYVPLNTPVSYDTTGPFAKSVAELLEQRLPRLVVSKMPKTLRRKRVLIDWSQNSASKTTVCVYSLRAKREEPFVSMPLEWNELARARKSERTDRLYFSPRAALARLEKMGDLFKPVLTLKQRLPKAFQSAPLRRSVPRGSLNAYSRKRDFNRTAEPEAGRKASSDSGKDGGGKPRFVVQKHDATNLHYDLRLEFDGVLKSWAIPKGLPYQLHVKRSAFQTEDHPIEYLNFEGTIPKGQYGGGTVMVWDLGTFDLLSGTPGKGSMRLRLAGKKLKGEWRIYRIRSENGKHVWLIEKGDKSMKPVSARRDNTSVLTRRSMARIAKDDDAQWHSD